MKPDEDENYDEYNDQPVSMGDNFFCFINVHAILQVRIFFDYTIFDP